MANTMSEGPYGSGLPLARAGDPVESNRRVSWCTPVNSAVYPTELSFTKTNSHDAVVLSLKLPTVTAHKQTHWRPITRMIRAIDAAITPLV